MNEAAQLRRRIVDKSATVLRRHRADFLIVLFMSVLMLLGLVVIYSISPALSAQTNAGAALDENQFMYRQLISLLLGLAAFGVATTIPLTWWQKYQTKFLIAAVIACLVPIIFSHTSLAVCANGACRWINLGVVTFQPVEALKFTLVIYLAGFLAARIREQKVNDMHGTLIPVGIILGIIALVVVVLQRDLGTGLAIFGIVVTMLYVAGLKTKYFALALAAIALAGGLFVLTSSYRLARITTFLGGSSSSTSSSGYQINQALIAVGSGGVTGEGLGRGIQAFGYLPEAANDSIFAIVAEKLGFIGTVAVLLIFAALFFRLLRVMDNAGSEYHRLLVGGVFGWVFTHAIVNIGAMLGIFPLTGVTLPFLSFGGTSLLFMMMALGLALQVSRYTIHQRKNTEDEGGGTRHEDRRSRRGNGWTRYASTSRY